jgi:hypothetical protein
MNNEYIFLLSTCLCFLALSKLIDFVAEVSYISSSVYAIMKLSNKVLITLLSTQKPLKCPYFKQLSTKLNQPMSYYYDNTGVLHKHFPHPSATLERNDSLSKKLFMEAIKVCHNIIKSVKSKNGWRNQILRFWGQAICSGFNA